LQQASPAACRLPPAACRLPPAACRLPPLSHSTTKLMARDVHLVPGRSCSEFAACCVTLRIEETQLRKLADDLCPHLKLRHLFRAARNRVFCEVHGTLRQQFSFHHRWGCG